MQKFWCSNICFHSQEQEDTQILYINKTFTPIKCAFDVIQHTSWLVLLAAFGFRWLPVLPIVARHWTKSSRYAGPHCCNAAKVEDWKPSRTIMQMFQLAWELEKIVA